MIPNTYFTLTISNPHKSFFFDFSFSYIKILRIEFPNLIGKNPNDWYPQVSKLSLLFTYLDKSGKKTGFPIDLSSQMRLDQWNPIIEPNEFVVPEENRGNTTSLGNYVTELNIELQCRDNNYKDAEVRIFFEQTPGVRE